MLEKNKGLRIELERAHVDATEAARRAQEMEENTSNLRQIVIGTVSSNEGKKRRNAAEKKFWEKVATPEVLALSEPAPWFPTPSAPPQRVIRQEIQEKEKQIRELKGQVGRLVQQVHRRDARIEAMARVSAEARNAKEEAERARRSSMGAVRRIQWLLQRQEKDFKDAQTREAYIHRLETRLLEFDRMLQKYRSRSTGVVEEEDVEDVTVVNPAEEDSMAFEEEGEVEVERKRVSDRVISKEYSIREIEGFARQLEKSLSVLHEEEKKRADDSD